MEDMIETGETKGRGAQIFGRIFSVVVSILVVAILAFAAVGVYTVTDSTGNIVQIEDVALIMFLEGEDVKLFEVESISASKNIETGEVFLSVTGSLSNSGQ
jgi:hypothetical protein